VKERSKHDALDTASLLANAAKMAVGDVPPLEPPEGGWPDEVARREAEVNRRLAERDAWRKAVRKLAEAPSAARNFQAIFVAEKQAQLLAWFSRRPNSDPVSEYWQSVDHLALRVTSARRPVAEFRQDVLVAGVPLKHDGDNSWVFICKFGTKQLHAAITNSIYRIVGLSAIGMLAGTLLSLVLARRVSRPILELTKVSRALGEGDLGCRIKVRSNDELGELGRSFNHMAESLQGSLNELEKAAIRRKAQQREMDVAAEIQKSLLPPSCPQFDTFEIAATSIATRDVGGDFYDFIPLPDGRIGVVIADAAGKGLPAALTMTFSRCLIRAYSQEKSSTVEALRLTGDFMIRDVYSDMFVTCFYGVIDPGDMTVGYVNAGHNPPVIARKAGGFDELPAGGPPLGTVEQDGLRQETCQVQMGDVLVLYTDGITEAHNDVGEQFGTRRLREVLKNVRGLSAQEVCDRIITAVNTFACGRTQFDDMTLVAVKVKEPVGAASGSSKQPLTESVPG
jgi:serine phosphatase RsbU (regulator of sigma subunit)